MRPEGKAAGARRATGSLVSFRNGADRCNLDYTAHLDYVIRSWCRRYPQLQHIDMDRVVVSVVKCRSRCGNGVCATVTSLRRAGGKAHSGRRCPAPRALGIIKTEREALYLLKFFLPRFHDLSVEEKIATVLHELYHIDPKFNGELRHFNGRHWVHGPSQGAYEKAYNCLKHDILRQRDAMRELFLDCTFATLIRRFGTIYGTRCHVDAAGGQGVQTVA